MPRLGVCGTRICRGQDQTEHQAGIRWGVASQQWCKMPGWHTAHGSVLFPHLPAMWNALTSCRSQASSSQKFHKCAPPVCQEAEECKAPQQVPWPTQSRQARREIGEHLNPCTHPPTHLPTRHNRDKVSKVARVAHSVLHALVRHTATQHQLPHAKVAQQVVQVCGLEH